MIINVGDDMKEQARRKIPSERLAGSDSGGIRAKCGRAANIPLPKTTRNPFSPETVIGIIC